MFFYYSGTATLDVLPPGEQYTVTIAPSAKSQKTTSEKLYDYLFSPEFAHSALFVKTTDFKDVPSAAPVPVEVKQAEDLKPKAKAKPADEKGVAE